MNDRVQKFDTNGTFLMKFGSSGSGDGEFYEPRGIAVDASGAIYVTDTWNMRVQIFNAAGIYQSQVAMTQPNSTEMYPQGIELDGAGAMYVVDSDAGFLGKYALDGTLTREFSYERDPDASHLCSAVKATFDANGNLYVVDQTRNNIKQYAPDGTLIRVIGAKGSSDGLFDGPVGVAVDADGNIYVADRYNNRIQKFDPNGVLINKFTSQASDPYEIMALTDIAVDANGNIYVTQENGGSTLKFDPNGNYVQRIGTNNTADPDGLNNPKGLTIGPDGMIYIANTSSTNLKKFDTSGNLIATYSTVSSGGDSGMNPRDIIVDAQGNMYITTTSYTLTPSYMSYPAVQKYTSNGTFISQFGSSGMADDQFYSPRGLALDQYNNLFVTDARSNDGRVSMWSPQVVPTAPQNVTQSAVSPTSARLSWVAPANTGSLSYTYTVQYRLAGATDWITAAASLPSSTTSYVLTGLTPAATYETQVFATNSLGSSPVAAISFVMTDTSTPGTLAETGLDMWHYAFAATAMTIGAIALMWRGARRSVAVRLHRR